MALHRISKANELLEEMADYRSEAGKLNISSYTRKQKYLKTNEDMLKGHRVGLKRFPLAKYSKRIRMAMDYNIFDFFF